LTVIFDVWFTVFQSPEKIRRFTRLLVRAWHLGAVICGAKTCYLGATYYGADPQGLFLQKSYKKGTYVKFFRKRVKLQKLRPIAPQPGGQGRPARCRAARAGHPAAGRPTPRDLRAIFSANF